MEKGYGATDTHTWLDDHTFKHYHTFVVTLEHIISQNSHVHSQRNMPSHTHILNSQTHPPMCIHSNTPTFTLTQYHTLRHAHTETRCTQLWIICSYSLRHTLKHTEPHIHTLTQTHALTCKHSHIHIHKHTTHSHKYTLSYKHIHQHATHMFLHVFAQANTHAHSYVHVCGPLRIRPHSLTIKGQSSSVGYRSTDSDSIKKTKMLTGPFSISSPEDHLSVILISCSLYCFLLSSHWLQSMTYSFRGSNELLL